MLACSPSTTKRDPDLTRDIVEPVLKDKTSVGLYFYWLEAKEVIREANDRFMQLRSKQ